MKIIYLALIEMEIYNAPRTHTIEVCENLIKLGHDVLLLVPRPWKKRQKFCFKVSHVPFLGWGSLLELLYNIILCFYLIYYIFKFKPDVVYERMLHNPLGLIITKIFKLKHFLEINGPPFKQGKWLKNSFAKIEIKKTDGIIVPSPKLKNLILREIELSRDKINFIPNGVDPHIFYPSDKLKAREDIGLSRDNFYLGYTGGIYFAYDFDFVFKVIDGIKKDIEDIKLLIVSHNIKDNYPENVVFIKNVTHDKIPRYINSFDITILPLNKEGIETQDFIASIKFFEYIACGKVVLVPNLNNEDIPELFRDFLVFYRYGDEEDFINKVKNLYYNREKLIKTKEQVQSFIKEYSWEETTKKVIEFIKS